MKNVYKWLGLVIAPLIMFAAACGGGGNGGTDTPVIASSDPADGATDVDYFKAITVNFNNELNETAINSDNVKLTRANGTIDVPGAVTYDLAAKSITFTPRFPMVAGMKYVLSVADTIFVNPSLSKADGDGTGTGQSLNFTTIPRPIIFTSTASLTDPTQKSDPAINNLWGMYDDGTGLVSLTSNTDPDVGVSGFRWNTISPGYRYLVYKQYSDSSSTPYGDLWLMDPDGSGKTKVTNGSSGTPSSGVGLVTWDHTGSRIYYAWNDANDSAVNLYALNPGNVPAKLTNHAGNVSINHVVVSPDNNRLAYIKITDGGTLSAVYDLCVLELDDPAHPVHELVHLGDDSVMTTGISYTPDGSKIYYQKNDYDTSNGEISYVALDAAGTSVASGPTVVVGNVGALWPFYFSLSPDGTKILYEVEDLTTFGDLYVANIDGSAPVLIKQGSSTSKMIDALRWSSDSSKVAFGFGLHNLIHDLWVANADGTDIINLTNFESTVAKARYFDGAWSPDGTYIMAIYEYLDTYEWRFDRFAADGSGNTNYLFGDDITYHLAGWWATTASEQ